MPLELSLRLVEPGLDDEALARARTLAAKLRTGLRASASGTRPESRLYLAELDWVMQGLSRHAGRCEDLGFALAAWSCLRRSWVAALERPEISRSWCDVHALAVKVAAAHNSVRVHGEPLMAWAPRRWLERTLQNLVSNAVRQSSDVEVRVFGVVEVLDRGPGVPAEFGDRIFEVGVRDAASSGAGRGLAFVAGVVKRERWTLLVLDRPGGGSVFRLDLSPGRAAPGPDRSRS